MKKFFIASLLILCTLGINADPVSKEVAVKKASAFMSERGDGAGSLSLVYQGNQTSVGRGAPAASAYYYIFNKGEDKGFVIVAGDDYAEDILGYSDTGSFDPADIPDNLREWLDFYTEEIDLARQLDSETLSMAKVKAASVTNTSFPEVEPFVKSHWHQHEPFNNKCINTLGYRSVVGCAGVALAQVLNYYKYPTASTSVVPGYGGYASLKATTFNWSLIKENYTYSGSETSAELEALAKLMLYSARAVQTSFGPETSSGYVGMMPVALHSYFGYSDSAVDIMREKFDNETWQNVLLEEILEGRPVVYSAMRYGGNGHAWILDGFDGKDMFHCNWGWGGQGDGYYRMSAFNPYVRGAINSTNGSYSLDQRAVVGISPNQVTFKNAVAESGIIAKDFYLSEYPSKAKLATGTYTLSAKNGLNGIYMYYAYRKTGVEKAYDLGVGIFKGDKLLTLNGVEQVKIVHEGYSSASTYWFAKWFWLSGLGVGLPDGSYVLKGVDRATGTKTWVPSGYSTDYYITLTVKNGVVTAKTVNDTSLSTLKVTKAVQNFEENDPNTKHMTFTIKNTGSKIFNSVVTLLVDGYKRTSEGIYIGAGEEKSFDFYFSATNGSHTISLRNANNQSVYSGTHTLYESSTFPELTLVSSSVKNISGNVMLGRQIDCSMTLKNGTKKVYNYDMNVTMGVDVVKGESNSYLEYNTTIPVSIPAGKTVTVKFNHMMSVGDNFYLRISDPNKTYVNVGKTTVAPAIVYWNADGERTAVAPVTSYTVPSSAVAVSFEEISNLASMTIKANSNPNTIYYLDRNAAVPAAIKSKNVVNEYSAGTITINGNYDFLVPQSFTAQKITYTCTPSLTYDGKAGWQGIVLPFAVEKVTAASKAVDWCRGTSDTDKDFLVKEYIGDTGTGVEFGNVKTWVAGTPYIMAVPKALVGKSMVFSAANAYVANTLVNKVRSTNYEFGGVTGTTTLSDVYTLNAKGSGFLLSNSAKVKGGSVFFQPTVNNSLRPASISIAGGEVPIVIGDFDGDGNITVSDIVSLVDLINRGTTSGNVDITIYDANRDGEVTVTDIMSLVNTVLEQAKQNKQ